MTTSPPTRLGDYTVLRRLGDGGMARALLARAPDGREVVLKIPLEASSQMTTRLRDEAQAGFRIRHRHVVSTLDFFVDAGHAVLVLEFIDGCALKDLRQLGGRPNPLPAVAVAGLGRAIAEGLAAIHAAVDEHGAPLGMLHRDVSPANVLIGRDGVPRLIDLGIARSVENEADRTSAGMLKGTLRYVAPELLNGAGYTPATDLWSLGVCLFEAAVGRLMVGGDPVAIFKTLMSGRYRDLRPGEVIEPDLATAIFALVAPEDARIRQAHAAAAIFTRLERALIARDPEGYTGQQWLQSWVPWGVAGGGEADEDDDSGPMVPAPAAPPPRLVLGDDRHGTAPTMVMPKVDIPVPVARVAPVARNTAGMLLVDVDGPPRKLATGDILPVGAHTVQMPQWLPEGAVDVDLGSLESALPAGSWDETTAPLAAPKASTPTPTAVPSSTMAAPTLQLPIAAIEARVASSSPLARYRTARTSDPDDGQ